MADRYWVGGTGTWNTSSTTNWSASSGGASGASVPTAADSIFFDQAGTYNVTMTGAVNCLDWTVSAGSVTFVTGTSPSMTVYGNVTWAAGSVAFSGATFSWQFTASGGSRSISTNNVSVPGNPTTFSNGTFNLGSAFTASINLNFSSNPTINTNDYALTFDGIGASVTLNLGSSIVTARGSTVFLTGTSSTINPGTSTLLCTYISSINLSLLTTGITLNNVIFTSNAGSSVSINNRNTFNNLSFTAPNFVATKNITFGAPQTINGSLSILNTDVVAANRRTFFASSTYGLAHTLTINGTTDLIDADFRDLYITGAATPISGTRIGNRGNCTGITFNTPKTVYWNLAGAQNWSASAWALTSGGTPSVNNFPLPQDTAIFNNAGSVTGTITLDSAIGYVGTVDMSARTSAMTIAFTNPTTCYGDWTNGSGTTFTGTLALTFSGGGTQTITSAGRTFSCPITIDTYGGTVQLADALNLNTVDLTITNGTFNTLGYAVTCNNLLSANSNVRTINLSSSTVTLGTGSGTIGILSTNLTFNAGTSNIILSYNTNGTVGVTPGGLTYYNVTFTNSSGTLGYNFGGGTCTFNNLTVAGTSVNSQVQYINFAADQIINGTLTVTGASSARRIYVYSSVPGTQRTLTVNSLSATNCDFRDIAIAGAAAGSSPTGAGDGGGNSGITFPAPKTVYWNLAGTQNWSDNGWCTASGGTPDVNNFPLAQDTAVIDNTGAITTLTIDQIWNIGTFDASLRTSAMTLSLARTVTVYGDWKFGTGVTSSSTTGSITFSKNGTQTITSNGVQFGCPILINYPSAYVQIADALSLGATRTLTLTAGTFDAVAYNVTIGLFINSSTSNTLKMGSGTWTLSGTGTVWNCGTFPTLIVGTSTIVLSDTSTASRTFTGGGLYYNKLTIGGATGISTTSITGANTFGELASTKTVAHGITLSSGFTITIGKWSVTGTAGNVVTVGPTSAASAYNLYIAGPANTGIDYLSISYCAVSTTSPGEFYVGANSTNTAGNTGNIIFTATPSPRTLYWVGGTGNWSSTTKWSTSSGGASGSAIPTSLDSVIFDSASNATAYTATIDAGVTIARCAAFTMAGPASGNITWAGVVTIAFHGNVTFAATGITCSYSNGINWAGNSSYTFTTNGLTLLSAITVIGINSTWTIGSALDNTNSLTVTYGNFNTSASNYNIIALLLSSNNSNVRGISLNGSTFTSTASGNIINFGTITNLTFNAGTSLIDILGNSLTFGGGGLTFYNVSITAGLGAAGAIQGANIFNNLTISTQTNIAAWQLTFNANQTINGTLTLGAGTAAAYRTFLSSNTIGTQRTLTCAAISSVTDIDFRDIAFAGAISLPVTGTRLGNCKGNSNITFDAGKTVYYRQTGSTNWGTTGTGSWSLTSGGAFDATAFPLAQDTAVFPAATYPASGSSTTINVAYNIGTIDMSLRTTNTMTISATPTSFSVYGNWINGSGTTFSISASCRITFAGRTTQGITTAGKTWTASLTIETPGGSVVLQDNFIFSVGTTNTNPDIKYGTFDANGYNVTLGALGSAYTGMNSTGTNVRTINFGSGTWTVQHGGNFMTLSGSNLTISGTATINAINTLGTGWTPTGNMSGMTFNLGGSGQVSFNSDCTIGTITRSYTAAAATLNLSNSIVRVGAFTAAGTAGNLLSIVGSSATSPAALIYTGAGSVSTLAYVIPNFVRAYPVTNTWSVDVNSTITGSLGFRYPEVLRNLGNFMAFF